MSEIIWDPIAIEKESMRRIDELAGPHGFSDSEWQVVRRMIHTSGDPEYMRNVRLSPGAVEIGVEALLAGKPVLTDTRMVLAGISTGRLQKLGVDARCRVADPEVAEAAKRLGITRSAAAMDMAAEWVEGGLVAIGNAPTALLRLLELMANGTARPALVIGIPVGFVSAAESKDLLAQSNHPHVTSVGAKGGSPMAACVVNALAEMALARIAETGQPLEQASNR